MQLLIFIVIIVVVGFCFYFYVKRTLKKRIETITCYTGGLGSGKTLLSVDTSIKVYRKQIRKWKRRRFFNHIKNIFRFKKKKFNEDKPKYFSNIPVKLDKKNWSYRLTKEHLLLQERLPNNSVVFIDEVGAFASQFMFKDENVITVFDEFVRFFRHYTKGGYIICNDQCSENINLTIRRRLNVVHNLANCLVIWRLCFYYERMMNISEEIKTLDSRNFANSRENDTQDNMTLRFKFLWHKKRYDTYCYSDRYNAVPKKDYVKYKAFKTLHLLRCPKDKEKSYTAMTDNGKE